MAEALPGTGQNTGSSIGMANLRPPWQKGQSGNPGGRPKSKVVRALLEPHQRAMVAKLLLIMRSGDNREALEAIKVMLSYAAGKPEGLNPEDLTDDELLAIVMRRENRPKT